MLRATRVQLLAVLLMIGFLAGAGVLSVQMTSVAGRAKLSYTDRAEEGQPPEVALGIAMGAFRGIFVNFLWIRANDLKQEGKFYEINDLVEAITRLQPRFSRVWVFHAWNMAYNISVSTQTRGERWEWVQKGVRLLRDRGIPQNPNDLLLHRELAWIFLHKIQGVTDDANRFYKNMMAQEWQVVLGAPPALTTETRPRDKAIEAYAAWLSRIADAPETTSELIEKEPLAAVLMERLRTGLAEDPTTVDGARKILQRYESHLALERSAMKESQKTLFGEKNKLFEAALKDPEMQVAWDQLVPHMRKRLLRDAYSMDIRQMVRFTRKYGPIDWRNPAGHALYWAAQGVERALVRTSASIVDGRMQIDADVKKDYDFINSDRIVIQAVQELYRTGELYFDFLGNIITDGDGYYLAVPSLYFADTYGNILDELVARSEVDDRGKRAFSFYSAGYENFLSDVILFFYRRGQRDKALDYQQRLVLFKGQNLNDPERATKYSLPIDQFVEQELTDRQISFNVAVQEVGGALQDAYVNGLLAGNSEVFRAAMEYAAKAHGYYMQKQLRVVSVNPDASRTEVMPRDFRFMAGTIFAQFMTSLNVDDARLVYGGAPNDLKLYAYDMLRGGWRDPESGMLVATQLPFESAFPEPEGIVEFRQNLQRKLEEEAARKGPATQVQ